MKLPIILLVCMLCVNYSNTAKIPAYFHEHRPDERIECEPDELKESAAYWYRKFDMWELRYGFIVSIVNWGNHTLTNTPLSDDGLITMFKGNKVHNYFQITALFQTNQILPFRVNSYNDAMFHFIRGDAAVIHTIDPNGVYKATELGFHTNQFLGVIEAGTLFSIDIKQHNEDKYVMVGVTFVRHPIGRAVYRFPTVDEILKKFPQHADIVNRLSQREVVP